MKAIIKESFQCSPVDEFHYSFNVLVIWGKKTLAVNFTTLHEFDSDGNIVFPFPENVKSIGLKPLTVSQKESIEIALRNYTHVIKRTVVK